MVSKIDTFSGERQYDPEDLIKNRTATVGILGLGYVGLPLAVSFAEAGFKVIGFDMQESRVASIKRGESYIADITSATLKKAIQGGNVDATADVSRLSEANAICICVPTPLTKTREPDLSFVVSVSKQLSENLRRGQLIILESTTYPGTTREVVLPILERSGLKAGRDFFLAYSPERVDPGNKSYGIKNTPKLVGGVDAESTRMAALLYGTVARTVVPLSSPDVAEMTKVFENVFRSVNIALVNEMAQLCEKLKISVWEVIEAASTKPFGYLPFYPGPGIGGHCIPLDPYYLSNKALEYDFHTRFIELAAEVNERMPYHVTYRIMTALNSCRKSLKASNVLVLGVAYKKDAADCRESPSLRLMELLAGKDAHVTYNDPYVTQISFNGTTLTSVELTGETLAASDCVIIATDHSAYDMKFIVENSQLVFDTRGATRKFTNSNIVRLGESFSANDHG